MIKRSIDRVIDGMVAQQAIDWDHAEALNPVAAPILRQLRTIDAISRDMRPASPPLAAAGEHGVAPIRWLLLLGGGIAVLQIVLAIVGYLAGRGEFSAVPSPLTFFGLLVFAAAASWLFAGGRRDPRALDLGGFFLLVASSFAPRFVVAPPPLASIMRGVFPDAFVAVFLWRFVRQFPRTVRYSRGDIVCAAGEVSAVVIGAFLFTVNVLLAHGAVFVPAALGRSDRSGVYWYWSLLFGVMLPAAPMMLVRRRLATRDERRRVAMFSLGFGIILVAVVAEIAGELIIPAFHSVMSRPENRAALAPFFFFVLALLPISSVYAVLVDTVLDVRVTVGRVVRYALTRRAVMAITWLPFAMLAAYAYVNRDRTVAELFDGWRGIAPLLLFAAGLVLTAIRDPALTFVDAHFNRPGTDLSVETATVAAVVRNARSVVELADALERELQRVLSVERVVTYASTAPEIACRAIQRIAEPLPAQSALAAMLRVDRTPLMLDSIGARLPALLPTDDRQWLAATGFQALVPLLASGDQYLGFIAVGRTLSGDRFVHAERSLLTTAASATALRLEHYLAREGDADLAADDQSAAECEQCGRIDSRESPPCACRAGSRVAAVPQLLAQKFRPLAFVGAGGMGAVYEAIDITLKRRVALKTLMRLTGMAADRLADEARAMAAVTHPNLATIYGVERWRGSPILVLEFLERGSLARRLRSPQNIDDVLRLGVLLAAALEQLHQSGVLHRDIKPSNIAFTRDDVPKLLDFGLAHFLHDPGRYGDAIADNDESSRTQHIHSRGGHLVGTPLYLAPEALDGAVPSRGFDIWALSMVLFEAIAGSHPFDAPDVASVLNKVRRARLPNLRALRADCRSDVAEAFEGMLSRTPSRRPASAEALRVLLERLD